MFVQLVMAAMTTAPCPISVFFPFISTVPVCAEVRRGQPEAALLDRGREGLRELRLHLREGDAVLGRLGPARLGSTVSMSRPRVSEKTGSLALSVRNRPCSLA